MDDSSSENENKTVSTFNEDEDPQMLYDDNKENHDNDDDDKDTHEVNDDKDEDTDDDDKYNKYTHTDDDYKGFAFLQNDVMCSLQDKSGIPASWILLDSQSMVDIFSKKKLLTNIRDSQWTLTLYCVSESVTIQMLKSLIVR